MKTIDGVSVGYTKNGNAYRKSKTGKKAGTTIGAVGATAGGVYALNQFAKNNMIDLYKQPIRPGGVALVRFGKLKDVVNWVKQFIKDPVELQPEERFTRSFVEKFEKFKYTKAGDFIIRISHSPILKNKFGRAGLVALAVALPIAAVTLVGRGVGAVMDKVAEHGAKKQADFDANNNRVY